MAPTARLLATLFVLVVSSTAWSTDACSTRAVFTAAEVSVSDGTSFRTESYFHSANAAAIRHIFDEEQLVAVEGPVTWAQRGEEAEAGSDSYQEFALGHQYHALLLFFDEISSNVRRTDRIPFAGVARSGLIADFPSGGRILLVDGDHQHRPAGFVFELPDHERFAAEFADWRQLGELDLPFSVQIDDGERTFHYRYTEIEVGSRNPLWFFEAIPAPAIDELQLYRLHRKLLAAHCLGDADMIADLSAAEITSANRGEISASTNDELRARFKGLFEQLDYRSYVDRVEPTIEISGDAAWMLVEVQAQGEATASGTSFDDQWAWVMFAKKIDGAWLHTGNVSNRKP